MEPPKRRLRRKPMRSAAGASDTSSNNCFVRDCAVVLEALEEVQADVIDGKQLLERAAEHDMPIAVLDTVERLSMLPYDEIYDSGANDATQYWAIAVKLHAEGGGFVTFGGLIVESHSMDEVRSFMGLLPGDFVTLTT